ncbi:MAG: DUF2062 domain-containing protein [Gammaproteobacteria bacterium]|nr:DUF2062 domain-containing protein [Gammaproteobacteria bacterium]
MPKRFLKQLLPKPHEIRGDRTLTRVFGTLLHNPNLWHLNRGSVTWAVFVGLLMAFVPIPFQMVLAAGGAIFVGCNLPVAVAMVWVTNPLTVGPIFYGAYVVGTLLIGEPAKDIVFEISLQWLSTQLTTIWQPFLLGCVACGVTAAALGAALVHIAWRINVSLSWRGRQRRRPPS